MQETELLEYCQRRGWESTLFRDHGQSGSKQDRPALSSLLSDLRKRKVDVILVWSLDRLARSLKQLLSIAEECKSVGADLVCVKQSVDTTLPAGRLTFQILGAVAEFERELLRERVKAGMAQALRAGKRIGRPALRHFGPGELERIRSLRTQGASVSETGEGFRIDPVDDRKSSRVTGSDRKWCSMKEPKPMAMKSLMDRMQEFGQK